MPADAVPVEDLGHLEQAARQVPPGVGDEAVEAPVGPILSEIQAALRIDGNPLVVEDPERGPRDLLAFEARWQAMAERLGALGVSYREIS